jgi:hypothetical protein
MLARPPSQRGAALVEHYRRQAAACKAVGLAINNWTRM